MNPFAKTKEVVAKEEKEAEPTTVSLLDQSPEQTVEEIK